MNNDLISREALKKAFENLASDDYNEPIWYQQTVFETINNAPTITPDKIQALMSDYLICRCEPERPKGGWIKWSFKTFGAMGDWEYKCSNCEKVYGGEYNYCPNCGADMRGTT